MTKAIEFMGALLEKASNNKKEIGKCYGFGHGEFNGHKVTVRLMDVRTNSKMQTNKNWKVDGKVCSASKVSDKISEVA